MVKIRTIIIALLIAIIGMLSARYFFQGEKRKLKKQFHLLSESVSKHTGETTFTMARKVNRIRSLFAESCEFKTPIYSFSGTYTPQEISSYAARGRLEFSKLSLRFYDLHIDFPKEGIAKVILTARLTGKTTIGEHVHETHEVECGLIKIENRWLFHDVRVVEVLRR